MAHASPKSFPFDFEITAAKTSVLPRETVKLFCNEDAFRAVYASTPIIVKPNPHAEQPPDEQLTVIAQHLSGRASHIKLRVRDFGPGAAKRLYLVTCALRDMPVS